MEEGTEQAPGCYSKQPVTTRGRGTASESPRKKAPRRSVEKAIPQLLAGSDLPLQPKTIARELRANHNSVKAACRRLANRGVIFREPTGYTSPRRTFEQTLERDILRGQDPIELPKVHDLHLTLRPENVRKVLKDGTMFDMGTQVEYRGPDGSGLQNPLIQSCQNIPPLSDSPENHDDKMPIERWFNTLDPMSLYQLWKADAAHTEQLSGGYQEWFDLKAYRVCVMLYGTGTVKVIVSNSEHPFTASELRESLGAINALFLSRTGVSFWDISNFFFIEKVHFSTDTEGEQEYSGATRLNCTVKQLDDWLYRVYEKKLGGKMHIRTESCLEHGNYDEHNLNAFAAFIHGGVTPTQVSSQLYMTVKGHERLLETVQRQQDQINRLSKTVENLAYAVVNGRERGG